MPTLARIVRHPIKSLGREDLAAVTLAPGATMPWDRVWAVAHEAAKTTPGAWAPCPNFVLGAKAPELMAVTATVDDGPGTVTLHHPRRPTLTVNPDLPADADALVAWTDPLVPAGRARPARVVRVPGRGMTDTDFPSVSLGSLASLADLSARMGVALSPHRFRLNLWLDGLAPWAELDWVGQEIALGPVRLRVREPVVRCSATTANPETGAVDADTLGALGRAFGHRHFGVYAEVVAGGTLRLGDALAP